jgi:hypothetical protein
MKEKTIVSSVVLAASLISYFYAKETRKDPVPHVMIGGFIGAILGEIITAAINTKSTKN